MLITNNLFAIYIILTLKLQVYTLEIIKTVKIFNWDTAFSESLLLLLHISFNKLI